MKTNIFAAVKAAVTTRQAAEAYGLKVTRNGMTCCPFHNDRHPSMKVDERYYCFGCHETGDVIDLTAKLFGLPPYQAAKKLAWDFHIDPLTPPPAAAAMKAQATKARQDESMCMKALVDYEVTLRRYKERFAPSAPDEPWDERFIAVCKLLDFVTGLVDQLYQPDADERHRLVQELMKDNVIQKLKTQVDSLGSEAAYGKPEKNAA